jgi:hypothetical protein
MAANVPWDMPHPHSVPWFQTHRPEIYAFIGVSLAEQIAAGKRHVSVSAPVKSGKREQVEAAASIFSNNTRHYFITSLDRKDVKLQSIELSHYGIRTCVASKDDGAIILDIQVDLTAGRRVMLFVDESDYGSGSRQKLSRIFNTFRENPNTIFVYFSATPEETEASLLTEREDYAEMEFIPPPTYCGAEYFLDNDLVFDPSPFFEKDDADVVISRHGLDVIRDSITADRHIGVVRVTGRSLLAEVMQNSRVRAGLKQQLGVSSNGRSWEITIITEKTSFGWEDRITQIGHTLDTEKNYLLVIFQTCTRGTDLAGWHHKLAFWHDTRKCNDNSNLNTLIQALLRVSHYSTGRREYGGRPQPIRLYGDRTVIRYAAYGDLDSYIAAGGRPPTRTRKIRNVFEYVIHTVATFAQTIEKCNEIGQPPPGIEKYTPNEGFYTMEKYGILQRDRERHLWSFEQAMRAAKSQYNRRGHYTVVPCYRDLSDSDSLVWLMTRKIGRRQRVGLPIAATRGSMYSNGPV